MDEAVLDDMSRLDQLDEGRLLWSLATAGAQVRRAIDTLGDFGVERLRGDQPRALLTATDSAGVSRLVTRLACTHAPALAWHGVELPPWAGPADALLVGSVDGRHPRLAELAADGARRGLALAVVAPAGSQVAAAAAGRAPLSELPRELNPRAARWSLLAPLLQALDALGIAGSGGIATGLLAETADALDDRAEACRPDADAFVNPAKALALEFAESVPLIAGAGALAGVAARAISDALQQFAGASSVSVSLPDGVGRAGALLRGSGTAGVDDFFRDRLDDDPVAPRPRLLVVGDDGSADDALLGDRSTAQIQLDEVAARRAARALHDLARELGLRSSSVDVPRGEPLTRFAAATAFGDFTAAYLALVVGLDPGQAAPVERPH